MAVNLHELKKRLGPLGYHTALRFSDKQRRSVNAPGWWMSRPYRRMPMQRRDKLVIELFHQLPGAYRGRSATRALSLCLYASVEGSSGRMRVFVRPESGYPSTTREAVFTCGSVAEVVQVLEANNPKRRGCPPISY